MRPWVRAFAVAVVAVSATAGLCLAGDHAEDLATLETLFSERGLEPLPGQDSLAVEGGVAGLFRGSASKDDEKPYVLVVASPPVGVAAVAALVDVGAKGLNFNGLPLPALLTSGGRHVIVAYLEDPESDGEAIFPLHEIAAFIDLSALAGGSSMSFQVKSAASSDVWMGLIEQTNVPLGLDLEIEEAPDLGSARAASYVGRNLPGLQLAASEAATPPPGNELRYVAASTFAAMIAAKVSKLDEPPPFQRIDRSAEDEKPTSQRPYTGTVPAYTADVEGLLLEGVLEGGPAEAAGLAAGDVIVELAGSAIKDVYTYADVLDTLEIDVPIKVVYLRDGERMETTLTPQGR